MPDGRHRPGEDDVQQQVDDRQLLDQARRLAQSVLALGWRGVSLPAPLQVQSREGSARVPCRDRGGLPTVVTSGVLDSGGAGAATVMAAADGSSSRGA